MKRSTENTILMWGIGIALFIFVLWLLHWRIVGDNPQYQALYGDGFGSLNTLFSGLALAGVVVALIMQQREAVESREHQAKAQLTALTIAKLQALTALVNVYSSESMQNSVLGMKSSTHARLH